MVLALAERFRAAVARESWLYSVPESMPPVAAASAEGHVTAATVAPIAASVVTTRAALAIHRA
jgi:hypothetical protein